MIDIHSHILPGVDDGAKTLTDSVEIIRELAASGVTDIVATPHFVVETNYTSPKKTNTAILEKLREVLADEGVDVRIFLGNEIYIDPSIESLIREGTLSTMAGGKYMLVELPIDIEYSNYYDILFSLVETGYKVILAHPERYAIMQKDYDLLLELHDIGVRFQCNLGSVIGQYGKEPKNLVKRLIKERLVFAFGSDIHYCHGASYWLKAQKKLAKYYTKKELKDVLISNSYRILSGE